MHADVDRSIGRQQRGYACRQLLSVRQYARGGHAPRLDGLHDAFAYAPEIPEVICIHDHM
jgi:hypothetical protein